MPGIGVGDIAADHRPQRRRHHGEDAGDRRRQHAAIRGKEGKARGEDRGNDGATAEALDHAEEKQQVEVRAERRPQAGQGEPADGEHKEPAQREQAREACRQRNRNDLGHEIGGLDPAQPIQGNAEGRLNIRQRAGDDLDVEDRHEHAEAHGEKADPGDGAQRDRAQRIVGRDGGDGVTPGADERRVRYPTRQNHVLPSSPRKREWPEEKEPIC